MSTALVGESGSGKSTVISLIERFYDPQSGQVLIDGINLKDFKLRWIRGKIGLVSQEPVLFSTTLQQNIAYGKDGATLQEIKTAVELANATKFIDKMPQGFETMVGENGTQLSGGQKQRIAIARAILKDPKILLLDEATSALDVESERIVQDALDRVMKNRTTVVVAHRLSTVKNVDMIEVISHGFIVEKGSHSELIMKQDGAYSKLVQLQEANKDGLSNNTALMGRRGSSLSLELSKQRSSSSIRPIYGLFIAQIITSFYQPPSKLKKETNFWGLLFLCIGLFTLTTMSIRSYLFAVAGSKLVKRVRYMCFKKVVAMEVGWFDNFENSSGAIGTRLSKDTSTIKTLVGESLAKVVENGSLLIAALIISFIASWRLSLIILVLIANNALGNIRTIASFSAEEKIIELFKNKCEIPIKSVFRAGLISGVGYGISNFMLYAIFAVIFYIGGKFVEDGKIEFSDVFRVFFVLLMAFLELFRNSTIGPDYINAKNATAYVFAILDRESKIDSEDDSGNVLKQVRGNIEFRHANFTYPTRPDLQIFLDFNFIVHSRKVTALVGESGCGKSTVISLLQRFYNLDSGNIFLDGNDIKGLNLKWFRSQMGLVSQEPVLFNNTIRANIAYGKKDEATESDIIASAESANAHKFISALPRGYDTLVGERGIQLSGGQK
ncbi:hypothetical protein ZOSMA_89G00190 [Zostera marina]|uniref:ABC transporter B family member n=1 Tax=Zostera marina TaxID=29655 RepID=A0A0K9NJX9_ZOSMR|nr:hypothetical protein ZOSMA_89G00190 [Zostera marina]